MAATPTSPEALRRACNDSVDRVGGTRPTVLVVDDDSDSRLLLVELLSAQCRVIEACDGTEALELVGREPRIDLILLDVMMPGMSGHEVLQRLRADVRSVDATVVFITGQGNEDEEERGLLLGAVDYICKPLRPALVRARIGNQLHLIEKRKQMASLLGSDALTGIANRRSFDEALERLRDVSIRSGCAFGLAMIDVDYFKQFNDVFGHAAGDSALRDIAAVVAQHGSGLHEVGARYGGEEFALLLPGTLGLSGQLESLRQSVLDLHIPHPHAPWGRLSISAGGLVTHAQADTKASDLVKRADALLYEAKRAGRNRVVTWLDQF